MPGADETQTTFTDEQIEIVEEITGLKGLGSFTDEEISNLDLDFTEVQWYTAVVAIFERNGNEDLDAMRKHLALAKEQES